jgi:hypothetical protein
MQLAAVALVTAISTPSVTLYRDQNTVFGRAQYKKDAGVVKYLGSFNATEDCEHACINYKQDGQVCHSFGFHEPTLVDPNPQSYATLCYGVTDLSWSPTHQVNTTSGIIHLPCANDEDCSLNGRCDPSGNCTCLAAWSGADCATLNLKPATKGAGLHAPNGKNGSISSWGGSVAYDEKTKKWQMFAAEMIKECGIGAWEQNSRIVRASSNTANGEYTVEEEIKPAFAHEPVLAQLKDKSWLLFSIGGNQSSKGPEPGCQNGYTPKNGPHYGSTSGFSGPVPVEIYQAQQLTGPWVRLVNMPFFTNTNASGHMHAPPLAVTHGEANWRR